MDTIQVSIGTLSAWFGKNAAELVSALTEDKDGSTEPLEQKIIDKHLDDLYSSRIKTVESTVRDQGHQRGFKEAYDKVESHIKELGIDGFKDWQEGIAKLSKQEKVKVKDITEDDIRNHALYKSLHETYNSELEAHKSTVSNFEKKESDKVVRKYYTDFLNKSGYQLPEDEDIKEEWLDLYLGRITNGVEFKIDADGKTPIPVNESGLPLEQDFKPVLPTTYGESIANRMFKKIDGTQRGGIKSNEGATIAGKTIKLEGDKSIVLPKPTSMAHLESVVDEYSKNPDVPADVLTSYIDEFSNITE